jgi:ankyrin repeat protein
MLHSLIRDLESVFTSTEDIARAAGWLLFQFAASPQFHVAKKDIDECCRLLLRLCHLESVLGQAIVVRYHEVYGKKPSMLVLEWPEVAASNGSYYAMESLRMSYPEKYLYLMGGPLDFEPRSADLDADEVDLLTCCREGNYAACKVMLGAGAPAFPSEDGMVSALHWLVSFNDESQINDLVELLLGNGAVLEAWEGEGDDFTFGRVHGTPLHWAIWHRNIPAVRALTKAEKQPGVRQVDRAIWIAATMHFYDVLEILKHWILSLKDFALSGVDWHNPFLFAADQSASWLPRLLRHGSNKPPGAFERTMDIILAFYRPSAEDVKLVFAFAIEHNNPTLLRYLYNRLGLGKRKDLLHNLKGDPSAKAFAMGFIEVVEVFIEKGLISPQSEHGPEKWRPLQLCCFTRQRDPTFARRLIEIGCPVDGAGTTEESNWTPFLIVVTLGMYKIAIMLLEHGANKDHLSGQAGGFTVTMNLLRTWPDIPLSRLKFLLEELPRLGFGHITFWGWPGAGGNLIYALSLNHWSSYAAGYRLGETAKYILSQLADKSCLNIIDKLGATALRMACANGNKEIIGALIEAGQDVNLALGYSPLRNAKDWLATCQKREKGALKGKPGSERRLARILRVRAEETVELLVRHGAIDRGHSEAFNNGRDYLGSGQWQKPSFEVIPMRNCVALVYTCRANINLADRQR